MISRVHISHVRMNCWEVMTRRLFLSEAQHMRNSRRSYCKKGFKTTCAVSARMMM
ncbi:hypothetical protein ANCDUO_05631 [Ancylostoma duodenale]|uniref:Uncharacterized protein n=1 Tax=Ancylostoma duodenale TaxID=51022 RepID=A0A0C2GRY2_9BILA|nr:hypothetical protein ANCDUO_05631 [Ancylostoma duodenale]